MVRTKDSASILLPRLLCDIANSGLWTVYGEDPHAHAHHRFSRMCVVAVDNHAFSSGYEQTPWLEKYRHSMAVPDHQANLSIGLTRRGSQCDHCRSHLDQDRMASSHYLDKAIWLQATNHNKAAPFLSPTTGIMVKDPFIYVPNGVGVALGCSLAVLKALFWRRAAAAPPAGPALASGSEAGVAPGLALPKAAEK